jgi:hypothetical protein
VAFAPDSRTLVTGAADGTLKLWETASGRPVRCFRGHTGEVTSVAFSSSGWEVASGSRDGTILVWDVAGIRSRKGGAPRLGDRQLEALWEALADADAAVAHRASWQLVGTPEQAVQLLGERLSRVQRIPPERLARLITEVEDKRFRVRERALRDLESFGELAIPVLRRFLARRPSVEARRRVGELLERLEAPDLRPRQLRVIRAIAVLERVGGEKARQLLETLSSGAPSARLTVEAMATLQRLHRH